MKTEQDLSGLAELVKEWIEDQNPFEDEGLYASDIKALYLVGSRAKGTHRTDSDYDIAVVFEKEPDYEGPTSLQLSDALHQRFGQEMPEFNSCAVDIQLFFDADPELQTYSKVDLQPDPAAGVVAVRSRPSMKMGV